MKKLALFLLLLLVVSAAEAQFAPGRKPRPPRFSGSTSEPPKPPVLFPELSGKNLAGEEVVLAKAFEGNYNLIFLVSAPDQEIFFETWMPTIRLLEERYENFRYYLVAELPPGGEKTASASSKWPLTPPSRPFITEEEYGKALVSLRTDRRALHQTLEVSEDVTLHILFVDGKREVIWNEVGARTNGKSNSLALQMARVASGER